MAKKGADGLDKRQRGALIRRERRKQVIEGLAGGRQNVVYVPRSLVVGNGSKGYLPFCTYVLHFGAIRNDAGCISHGCSHYRQFPIHEKKTISGVRSPGDTNYDSCPLDNKLDEERKGSSSIEDSLK